MGSFLEIFGRVVVCFRESFKKVGKKIFIIILWEVVKGLELWKRFILVLEVGKSLGKKEKVCLFENL